MKSIPMFFLMVLLLLACSVAQAQIVVFPDNDHRYEYVPFDGTFLTWDEARIAAAQRQFVGINGHLVTISNRHEPMNGAISQKLRYREVRGNANHLAPIYSSERFIIMFNQSRTSLRLSLTGAIAAAAILLTSAVSASTPIHIVNNLEQALDFVEVVNRQNVQIKQKPPQQIPAKSTGTFAIAQGNSTKNPHLKVKYAIRGSDATVEIVYKLELSNPNKPHCPKEHPDWVTESVEKCGHFGSDSWTYTFSPSSD